MHSPLNPLVLLLSVSFTTVFFLIYFFLIYPSIAFKLLSAFMLLSDF